MEAVRPVSLYVVVVVVPIWTKLAQLAPWQRSTKYSAIVPPASVDAVQVSVAWFGLLAAATTADSQVFGWLSVKVALYVPGVAPSPVSAERFDKDAEATCVKPEPDWNVAPAETFTKPASRSFVLVVIMFGLTTFSVLVPLSLPMRDTASIGEEIFEPFTTMIDMTKDKGWERFMVTV